MNELQSVARLKIHDGKLDEFKRLAAKCAELVCTKDTWTLQYELYFNSDNTECLVFERYRDSQALLDHLKNLGDTMAAILQTCSGSGEVCGTPSAELMEKLEIRVRSTPFRPVVTRDRASGGPTVSFAAVQAASIEKQKERKLT